MNAKGRYIGVGLFVLVFSTAFVWGVLWFSSGGPHAHYQNYVVYMMESVSGVGKDTAVTYLGVEVGRVKEIGVDPDNLQQVRLLLQVDDDIPIKEDTIATLNARGLTGIAYVNLSGGSHASAPLAAKPGELYPVIKSESSVLGRLDERLLKLIERFIETSNRMNALFDETNRLALSNTIQETEQLMKTLRAQALSLDGMLKELTGAAQQARLASARLPQVLDQVKQSIQAVENAASQFSEAGDSLKKSIEGGGRDMAGFTRRTLPEVEAMVGDLRRTAEHLKRASAALEQDPSRLLYGPPAPKPGPGE